MFSTYFLYFIKQTFLLFYIPINIIKKCLILLHVVFGTVFFVDKFIEVIKICKCTSIFTLWIDHSTLLL